MNDNELRDKLAKEIILKESIICSHNEAIHDALESNAITGFNLGWDAARANPLRDEKRLWTENEELRKERDQLREAAEKLAEALEYAKKDPTWYANLTSKASLALAEYRSKFPKGEK